MSKKRPAPVRDKRSSIDLELFVLALVQRDVNTPYALLATAGLSPGATIPVLARLEGSGSIRKGKPGPRGRAEYQITATGRQHLNTGWRPLLEVPARDMESVLRTAVLAILSGAAKQTVTSYLKEAAEYRVAEARRRRAASTNNAGIEETELYGWMQAIHFSARLETESKVLRKIASSLNRRHRPASTSD